ncbi:caspase family protein [Anaerobacillus sp. CMMVII]|uniref:caspase family protein n=1 Tax=Anaerobacillus sp. CMMVII TaxID=2755588 RepID=UPI0021B75DF1|nr:caspase family protein [Anaerobacillus sp. CMMVII]MCT8140263.1 caspase family protein [Anaerobacillus sp. CMMVII]
MKKRIALVIGNSNYYNSPLKNPINDSNDITDVLTQLGFEVEKHLDITHIEMETTFIRFIKNIKDCEASLVYFAGHGLQIKGENYLAPVDIEATDEVTAISTSYNINDYLRKISNFREKTNIIILDACRNNPFINTIRGPVSNGFAPFKEAPIGTFISYSTSPDSLAGDGKKEDSNGLYTGILKECIKIPNIIIEETFKLVRSELSRISGGNQISWEHSSLIGDFYFSVIEHTDFELAQEDVYQFITERSDFYKNKNLSIYDTECLPIVDAYFKYQKPIIEIMRLYSRESYSRINQKFTDNELDFINMGYLSSWGFEYKEHRWYYGDQYVKMGDPLPLPERLLEKEPIEGKELIVELSPKGYMRDSNIFFRINTNLPNKTKLMFTLYTRDNKYRAQCKTDVIDGAILTEGFSYKGNQLEDGMYLLSLSSPLTDLQPENVKTQFGVSGRNLMGKFVRYGALGGKSVRGEWTVIKSKELVEIY